MVKQRGFSLVELLVALVILTAVIALAGQAFSLFSKGWSGRLGRFDQSFSEVRSKLIIEDTLRSLRPYVVPNQESEGRVYFEGNPNGFVAVSQRYERDREVLLVVRLSLVQAADLTYGLLYEERPFDLRSPFKAGEKLEFSAPVVLASGLTAPNFRYYGVKPAGAIQGAIEPSEFTPAEWSSSYNSLVTFQQPLKIQLTYTDAESAQNRLVVPLVQAAPGNAMEVRVDF